MGRKRKKGNEGYPPYMYKKKGIYYYRDRRNGKEYSLGRDKTKAINETIHTNLALFGNEISLLDRINNIQRITLHGWLDQYEEIINKRQLSYNSIRDYKIKISIIKKHLSNIPLEDISPKPIADFINNYPKPSMAKQLRLTLSDAFNEAIAAGHVTINPVSVTKAPKTKIQRSRLTLDQFNIVLNNAPNKYRNIFLLAVLTGQRIGDLVTLKWTDIKNEKIYIVQEKTGARIAIPIALRLNALGISLNEVLDKMPHDKETICNISQASLRNHLNKLLPDAENKPTFHEIRSLSARLYEEEKGAEFAKKLLGHKSMVMTDKYLDSRNNSYTEL